MRMSILSLSSPGKLPFAVQNFGSRPIQPNGVVPALRDRDTVRNFAVAAPELDGDRAISFLIFGDVVHGIRVVRVTDLVADND